MQGQWRRIAAFDYSNPLIASWGPWVIVSLVGGIILAASALLFVWNLVTLHRSSAPTAAIAEVHYAEAVHPPAHLPTSLNGFGLWNILVAVLMLLAYGYPIAQFFIDPPPQAVVHRLH